jgi:hypothetical protein
MRHAGFVCPEQLSETLNIVGVGAVGSWVGLTAARMGFTSFRIWDADLVEDHNLPNQIYNSAQVGMRKVEAFAEALTRFNPEVRIEAIPDFFTSKDHKPLVEGPLCLAVDTMAARKDLVQTFGMNWRVPIMVEARLGFDHAVVNVVDPMNILQVQGFEAGLRDDSEVPEGPCSLRICTTMVQIVASYIVHLLCKHYSADRGGWVAPRQAVFSLTPRLELYYP